MVSEPNIERCANEEVDPEGGIRGDVPARTLDLEGGGLGGPASLLAHRLVSTPFEARVHPLRAQPQRGWIEGSHID